jgi:hypothetical protein
MLRSSVAVKVILTMCDQIEAKACALFPCVILATAVADDADLGRLTAQKRDGRAGAVGSYAAKRKLMQWKLVTRAELTCGYRSSCRDSS